MNAQEFSSPAEHMASINSNNGISSRGVINNGQIASSVGFPPMYYSSGQNFDDLHFINYKKSSRTNNSDISDFLAPFMKYNSDLFASAQRYDERMSNTAIQRQMEDLKAAGINPIIAGRLGGAVYKGVSAPYLTLNPATALNAMLDYESSIYKTNVDSSTSKDIAQLQVDTSKFLTAFNRVYDDLLQDKGFVYAKDLAVLNEELNVMLDDAQFWNKEKLLKLGFTGQKDVNQFQNVLNKDFKKYSGGVDLSNEKAMSDYRYDIKNNEGLYNWIIGVGNIAAKIGVQSMRNGNSFNFGSTGSSYTPFEWYY